MKHWASKPKYVGRMSLVAKRRCGGWDITIGVSSKVARWFRPWLFNWIPFERKEGGDVLIWRSRKDRIQAAIVDEMKSPTGERIPVAKTFARQVRRITKKPDDYDPTFPI